MTWNIIKKKERVQKESIINEVVKTIEMYKCSNLEKLLRVTAWAKRFIANLKNSVKNCNLLTAEEIIETESFLIKSEQKRFFKEQDNALKNKNLIKKGSP